MPHGMENIERDVVRKISMSGSDLFALVDDEDYERLARYRWCAVEGRRGDFYAARTAVHPETGKVSGREMQRDVLDPDMAAPRAWISDHRNHNTLDNQRHNLRWLDHRASVLNRRLFANNTSGYRGVTLSSRLSYRAALMSGGVRYMSYHSTASAAARAYNDLAIRHHGEHAQLNIIPDESVWSEEQACLTPQA